jgi:DNA-directed RNA polymerase subunit RPC12/RpoP
MSTMTYRCSVCGREIKVQKDQPVPLCCKKEMGPLPYCTEAPNPEMARNYDEDLPCSDGTETHPKPEPRKK